MTLDKSIQSLEELVQVHMSHSNGMKEYATHPGRSADMRDIGLMISQNHESIAEVLKIVINDLKLQQEGTKKSKPQIGRWYKKRAIERKKHCADCRDSHKTMKNFETCKCGCRNELEK